MDFGYDDLLSNFFDDFHASWTRPFKEKNGYSVYKTSYGALAIFNTLGVNSNDIKVKHSDCNNSTNIVVEGKTKLPELDDECSVRYNCTIKAEQNRIVEDVQYKTKDGLTYVYIKLKSAPQTSNTGKDATKIDIDESAPTDW